MFKRLLIVLTVFAVAAQAARAQEATDSVTVAGIDTLHLTSTLSDSVLVRRLEALNPCFSLPFDDVVRNYMVAYSEKRGVTMQQAVALSDYYFPIFEECFRRYGLPLELKYLAIVESMLKPTVMSRAVAL